MVDTDERIKQEIDMEDNDKNLSIKLFVYTYVAIIFGFILLLPMIYIKNQIYYHSRDISALWNEYLILAEENSNLRQKIENIRFKHKILDALDIK